jgi:tRNA G37 N-methylase Trm5
MIIFFVAMGLVIVAIAVLALFSTVSDALRRRRGEDRDTTIIADSGTEFEVDVGKPDPGL